MSKRNNRNLIIITLFFFGIMFITFNKELKIMDRIKSESVKQQQLQDSIEKLIIGLSKDSVFLTPTELQNDGYILKNDFERELFDYLKAVRVENIWIVFAQARLESKKYKSKVFLLNNNLFGMKKSYQRPTVREEPDDVKHIKSYSYYKSWEFSVIDYVIWQTSYARGLSEKEYIKKLIEVGYAEDEYYEDKITKLAKQLKQKYNGK